MVERFIDACEFCGHTGRDHLGGMWGCISSGCECPAFLAAGPRTGHYEGTCEVPDAPKPDPLVDLWKREIERTEQHYQRQADLWREEFGKGEVPDAPIYDPREPHAWPPSGRPWTPRLPFRDRVRARIAEVLRAVAELVDPEVAE